MARRQGCVRWRRGRRVGDAGSGHAVGRLVATDARARHVADRGCSRCRRSRSSANVFAVDNADVYVRWHARVRRAARRAQRDRASHLQREPRPVERMELDRRRWWPSRRSCSHILWAWRSAHNARALGRTGARLAPGWAIGAWFIPIANFVLVYILFSDLWRSSDPESEPRRRLASPPRIAAGAPLDRRRTSVASCSSSPRSGSRSAGVTGVVDHPVPARGRRASSAPWAPCSSILVVRDITARQEVLQAREPAPTRASGRPSVRRAHHRRRARAGTPTRARASSTGTGTARRGPSTSAATASPAPRRWCRPTGTRIRPGGSTGGTGPVPSGPSTSAATRSSSSTRSTTPVAVDASRRVGPRPGGPRPGDPRRPGAPASRGR